MKKVIIGLVVFIVMFFTVSCSNEDNTVVIYSSSEDFRNEYISNRLQEEFPEYEIILQYNPTGKNAAKLKAEGISTDADIIIGLESSYLEQLKDILVDLSNYDMSHYMPNLISDSKKYASWELYSGAILLNEKLLEEKGLPIPTCYDDLLKPEYSQLISMPNPKLSGTGYMFYKNLVNTRGLEAALEYFDKLSKNVLMFTSSGSGPVKNLVAGETAIGLGMTFQATTEINKGASISITFFEEGAPYNTGGIAIIKGKEERKPVVEVFDFIYNTIIYEDKEKFVPEQIFVDQEVTVANYPKDIKYADMTGILDADEKTRLLEKWVW